MKKILIIFLLLITIPVNASSIVMDIDSNRILYEENKDEQRLIASITKIMTAIITIENNKDLNKKITVGEEVLTMYGTSIYLQVGEQMSIKDLLYGLILRSGNDAALVLAINTSKTEENFVKMMNANGFVVSIIGMQENLNRWLLCPIHGETKTVFQEFAVIL